MSTALLGVLRAGGSVNRMIRDSARRQAELPTAQYGSRLRAMAGSRRTAPGVTHLEPLIDVLAHGQDVTVPLGRHRDLPAAASAAAVHRIWPDLWPFRARRRLPGFTFVATDADCTVGDGERVEGPAGAILLLLTGRAAALPRLSGPGLATLTEHLAHARTG